MALARVFLVCLVTHILEFLDEFYSDRELFGARSLLCSCENESLRRELGAGGFASRKR